MKFIGAGLTHQADDTGRTALVGGWRILRLHANFFDTIFRNIHCRNNRGGIIFRNSDRAAIEHVVNGSHDGAVDRVGGNIDSRPPARDVLRCDVAIESLEFGEPLTGITPALNCTRS